MIGNIYYQSYKKGFELFQDIVKAYRKEGLVTDNPLDLKYSNTYCQGHFANGDIWRTIQIGDGARGYRWDTAYIDNNISVDDVKLFIVPYCLHNAWVHHTRYY